MSNTEVDSMAGGVGGGGGGEGGQGRQTERNDGGNMGPAASQAPDYSAETVDAMAQAQTISAGG